MRHLAPTCQRSAPTSPTDSRLPQVPQALRDPLPRRGDMQKMDLDLAKVKCCGRARVQLTHRLFSRRIKATR